MTRCPTTAHSVFSESHTIRSCLRVWGFCCHYVWTDATNVALQFSSTPPRRGFSIQCHAYNDAFFLAQCNRVMPALLRGTEGSPDAAVVQDVMTRGRQCTSTLPVRSTVVHRQPLAPCLILSGWLKLRCHSREGNPVDKCLGHIHTLKSFGSYRRNVDFFYDEMFPILEH